MLGSGLWPGCLALPSTSKPPVRLHLNGAFICEDNIFEVIFTICLTPVQPLDLVHVPNQLAVCAASEGPA